MAWDTQEVYPRRQGLHDLLLRCSVLLVLYHQDLVRYSLLREEIWYEVRCRGLHLIYVFRVRIALSSRRDL